jgi:hypothetical protein
MKKKISIVVLWAMALAVLTCGCARADHDADLDVLMPMTQTEGEQGDAKQEVLEEGVAEEGTEPSHTEETEPSHIEETEPSPMEEEVDSAESDTTESADAQKSEYLEYAEVLGDGVILYRREMKVRRPKAYTTVAELLPDLAGEDYIIFYGDAEDYDIRPGYDNPQRIQVMESFYGDVKAGDTVLWQAVGMVVQYCSDVNMLFPTPGGAVPYGESVFILKVVERNGSELTCEAPLAWYSEIEVHKEKVDYIEQCINDGTVTPKQLFTLDLIETYLK